MKIPRKDLLAVLKIVEPAISSNKNAVEELSHIWFSGKYVSAFNDLLGLQVSFKTEFSGGVRGDKILGILENSLARDITIEEADGGNLFMKAGSAHVTFALRPFEDWFWHPTVPDAKPFQVSKEFIDAIDLTLLSVGSGKVLNPEQRGITIIQNGGDADLYSTDSVSISWMKTKSTILTGKEQTRAILPTPFCEQFVKMATESSKLTIDENAVYYTGEFKSGDWIGDVLLFSKLVEDDNPVPFADVVNGYVGTKGAFPIPNRLKGSLDRALVLLSDGEPADIQIKDEKLLLYAQSSSTPAEVDDVIKLEKADKHAEILVKADPGLLKRGIEGRDDLAVTKDCLIMTGPKNFVHIISTK